MNTFSGVSTLWDKRFKCPQDFLFGSFLSNPLFALLSSFLRFKVSRCISRKNFSTTASSYVCIIGEFRNSFVFCDFLNSATEPVNVLSRSRNLYVAHEPPVRGICT